LAILFFHSTLSKVTVIEIVGNTYVDTASIEAVLDVQLNDQFFLVGAGAIEADVKQVAGIQDVRVVKTFPGKIAIHVTEYPAVAWEYADDGEFVVLSNGLSLPQPEGTIPPHLPILSGWEASDPVRLQLAAVLAEIGPHHLADVSEILPYPSASYPDRVKIYTRSKYEVITAVQYLEEMLPALDNVILDLKQAGDGPGTLTMLEAISYAPFGAEDEGDGDEEGDDAG
jgi:cell division protein FtsQ